MANVEGSIYRVENGVAVPYANLGGGGGAETAKITVETGSYGADYTYHYITAYSSASDHVIAEVFGCVTQLTIVLTNLTSGQTFNARTKYTFMELNTQEHRDILAMRTNSAQEEGVCNVQLWGYANQIYGPLDVLCVGLIDALGNVEVRFTEDFTTSGSTQLIIRAIFVNRRSSSGSAINLGDLGNVTLTSPTAGQGLVYDATNQRWINGTVGGGSTYRHLLVNTTSSLTDCIITIGAEVSGTVTDAVISVAVGNSAITISNGENREICLIPSDYQYLSDVRPQKGYLVSSSFCVAGSSASEKFITHINLDFSGYAFSVRNFSGADIVLPANSNWKISTVYVNRTVES